MRYIPFWSERQAQDEALAQFVFALLAGVVLTFMSCAGAFDERLVDAGLRVYAECSSIAPSAQKSDDSDWVLVGESF